MGWHAKYNCEHCDFMVRQFDINENEIPFCILKNIQVGLLETCKKYKKKTGNHIT